MVIVFFNWSVASVAHVFLDIQVFFCWAGFWLKRNTIFGIISLQKHPLNHAKSWAQVLICHWAIATLDYSRSYQSFAVTIAPLSFRTCLIWKAMFLFRPEAFFCVYNQPFGMFVLTHAIHSWHCLVYYMWLTRYAAFWPIVFLHRDPTCADYTGQRY